MTQHIALAGALAALVCVTSPALCAEQESAGRTALAAACDGRDGWAEPAPPARIHGNTWYVGTCGISALLVTAAPGSNSGHVLIDGGVERAAPLVLANIRRAGFDPGDVRWIVSSHEHHDHVGALAALQRATGARVAVLDSAETTMRTGRPSADDPQADVLDGFAPPRIDRILHDGDVLTLGSLALTVHATPAHSPGSASWTWQACDAQFTCHMVSYLDSASTISADNYRFFDHPDRMARVRAGLDRMAGLPCAILVTPHPSASGLFARFAGTAPLVDSQGCTRYAAQALARFEKRLASERADTITPKATPSAKETK